MSAGTAPLGLAHSAVAAPMCEKGQTYPLITILIILSVL